jgi:hypothetical protein
MTHAELRRLARVGAEARLVALQGELEAILRAFPDLRRAKATETRQESGQRTATPVKRRRKMSPSARKRIAEAQRRRWAAWRKKNAKTAA